MTSILAVVTVGFLCSGLAAAASVESQVQCDSWNFAYATCSVGGTAEVIEMSVSRKDSNSACTFGTSYGFSGSNIWVSQGCRALFNVRTCTNTVSVDCDSWNFAYATCPVPGTTVDYILLTSRRSTSSCTLGDSYGPLTSAIFVNNGCRATFNVCYV